MSDQGGRSSRQQRRAAKRASEKAGRRNPLANAAIIVGATFAAAQSATAATFTVTNTNDGPVSNPGDQPGTLRQAIFDANANADADIITFSGAGASGTIVLTEGVLRVTTGDVDIQGPGAHDLTISGDDSRVFYLYDNGASLDVSISGLTLTNGANNGRGGAIRSKENLTLDSVLIHDSSAVDGGCISHETGTLSITNSTLANCTAGSAGGGLFIEGTATIENSTFSGNSAQGGGSMRIGASSSVTVTLSTINGGNADYGGNVHLDNGTLTLQNSILANGAAITGPDINGGGTVNADFSLIENPPTISGANNITGVDPALFSLAENGGPTPTHRPMSGSPVIDAGDPAFTGPPTLDQRGQPRVINSIVDMGSVEVGAALTGELQFAATSSSVSEAGTSIDVVVNRIEGSEGAVSVTVSVNGTSTATGGGTDFTFSGTTLNWADNDSAPKTFTVNIHDDGDVEGVETIVVELSAPTGGATLGTVTTHTIKILDDEPATIPVNTTADVIAVDGDCSLREAIDNANDNSDTHADCVSGGGFDTVTFVPPATSGTITMDPQLGQFLVEGSLHIQGPGSENLSIDATDSHRIFRLDDSSGPQDVDIDGLTLTNGHADDFGGAILFYLGNLTLDDVTITSSHANRGGALAFYTIDGRFSLTIQNSTISGNTADDIGGGIYVNYNADVTITDSIITGNTSTSDGGGVYMFGSQDVLIARSQLTGNEALDGRGAGLTLAFFYGPAVIDESTIAGNTASGDGGGVFLYASGESCGCPGAKRGGVTTTGAAPDPTPSVSFIGTTISGNVAGASGGGLMALGPVPVTFENSTISGNSATAGGALATFYYYGGTPVVTASLTTIAANSATAGGGNVHLYEGAMNITNTIIADGVSSDPDTLDLNLANSSTLTASFSLIETPGSATIGGANNIFNQDPDLASLADNDGPTLTMLPAANSPAVDAGDPSFTGPPNTDQRGPGFARVFNSVVDMGAVEVQPPPASGADLTIDKDVVGSGPFLIGQNVQFLITVTNNGPDTASSVIVTDQIPSGTSFVSATPSQGGPCTGTTTITCNLGSLADDASATITLTVTVQSPGTISNTATVDAAESDPVSVNNSATAVLNAGADIPTLDPRTLMILVAALAAMGIIAVGKRT